MVDLIIQLISGAVGGNLAGSLLKKYSLGTIINSIVGIIGGGLGGQILGSLGVSTGTTDIGGIIGSILGGGVGGGILMTIIGLIKNAMGKRSNRAFEFWPCGALDASCCAAFQDMIRFID